MSRTFDNTAKALSDDGRRAKYNQTGSTRPGHARDEGIKSQAMNGLTKLLAEIVQKADVDHQDILEIARTNVDNFVKEQEGEQQKLIKVKKRHMSAAKRTKAKTGENVAQMMLNSVIDVINRSLKEVGTNLKILQKMREILDNHEYTVDAKPMHGGYELFPYQERMLEAMTKHLRRG